MSRALLDFALFFARASIGLYFALAGWGKVLGEFDDGFGSFYRGAVKGMSPDWLPEVLAQGYGYALPWVELIVGGLLVIGLFGRVAAGVLTLTMVSILMAQFDHLGAGTAAKMPDLPGPFNPNFIYTALVFLLLVAGPGCWSVDAVLFRESKKVTTPKS